MEGCFSYEDIIEYYTNYEKLCKGRMTVIVAMIETTDSILIAWVMARFVKATLFYCIEKGK